MAEKKVVVHLGCITTELKGKGISSRRRKYLENALEVIQGTWITHKN
jgi:hypothetical protein